MIDEPRITPNCRQDHCRACTGCDHACHGRPMPEDFRALVARARMHAVDASPETEEARR